MGKKKPGRRGRIGSVMTIRVVLLALVACVCPWAQTPTISERLDSLLRKFDRNDAPGVAAMVIYKGQVAYQRGFGMADLENKNPITPQTQFLLASVSKQFTAMGIMIARERGKLRYDDPLSKFVPEFPEYASRITIRHLLQHLSGLPDYEEERSLFTSGMGTGQFSAPTYRVNPSGSFTRRCIS